MAKLKKEIKEKAIEVSLWESANKLRGSVEPAEYEYFLSKFALAEGKGKGEFYTPKSIVNLIAEMIEPYKTFTAES